MGVKGRKTEDPYRGLRAGPASFPDPFLQQRAFPHLLYGAPGGVRPSAFANSTEMSPRGREMNISACSHVCAGFAQMFGRIGA